jgi:hypothetical protein
MLVRSSIRAPATTDPPAANLRPARYIITTKSTAYNVRYFALELRRRGAAGAVKGVSTALFDARVDLNPHQIEATLFAMAPLRGPSARESGRLLADEVGLGKTIEAGLVLCQLWAERRRRLLVVCPGTNDQADNPLPLPRSQQPAQPEVARPHPLKSCVAACCERLDALKNSDFTPSGRAPGHSTLPPGMADLADLGFRQAYHE